MFASAKDTRDYPFQSGLIPHFTDKGKRLFLRVPTFPRFVINGQSLYDLREM